MLPSLCASLTIYYYKTTKLHLGYKNDNDKGASRVSHKDSGHGLTGPHKVPKILKARRQLLVTFGLEIYTILVRQERPHQNSRVGRAERMGRKPCCEKVGLKRGPWTSDEDQKLVSYITNNGLGCWRAIPKLAGLLRCGKSCRLRWTNYLRPDLKRGIFSEAEENMILDLHADLGNRWSRIAARLPGRTDNEIKNYWNTRLKKRLRSQGLDPATHLPLESSKHSDGTGGDTDTLEGEEGHSSDASNPSGAKVDQLKKAAKADDQAKAPRQRKGPKPAPQLKVFHSDKGLVLLQVPKTPKSPTSVYPKRCNCDDESEESSSSTGTTKSNEDQQASNLKTESTIIPSFSEEEFWESPKPHCALSTSTSVLKGWEACCEESSIRVSPCSQAHGTLSPASSHLGMDVHVPDDVAMQTGLQMGSHGHDVGGSYGGLFQGTCFPQSEMGLTWPTDGEMGQPAPESLYGPTNPSCYYGDVQQTSLRPSQELQRLAAILDLI